MSLVDQVMVTYIRRGEFSLGENHVNEFAFATILLDFKHCYILAAFMETYSHG